jgi:MraZ protein
MLLGEYEHTLDDKKRLTLPAKFRRDFEDGCVVSRGLDGCLVAWTPEGWAKYEETTLSTLNQLSRGERQLRRYLLSGATDTTPDRQGRVLIPPTLVAHAKLDRDVVVTGVNDRLEIWDRDAWRRELSEVEGSAEDVAERLAQRS